jgi:hypothetical protein
MSYEKKANANREVADKCMMGDKNRECVAASRYYYSALLFVRGYLQSHDIILKRVSHTSNESGYSIWKIAFDTLERNHVLCQVLIDFEGSYRILREKADYEGDVFEGRNINTLDRLKIDTIRLFKGLEYAQD